VIILFFSIGAVQVAGQSPAQDPSLAFIGKTVLPSPNSTAIARYAEVPVDYSTGVPDISYPFFSWQRNSLTLHLGLSYHSGGTLVEPMAPNTGLGWSLLGVGRISRIVKGIPDDNPVYGFMNTPEFTDLTTSQYDPGKYYFIADAIENVPEHYNRYQMISHETSSSAYLLDAMEANQLDPEQDVFSVNAGSLNFSFVIDKNKYIQILSTSNAKVSFTQDSSGYLIRFTVVDEMGMQYEFSGIEHQQAHSANTAGVVPPPPDMNYTSSWLLTKISSPVSNESIEYSYFNDYPNYKIYESGFSENETINFGQRVYNGAEHRWEANWIWDVPNRNTDYQVITLSEPVLGEIRLPDSSRIQFQYDLNREDFQNDKALTQISIYNSRNEQVKRYELKYSYFNCSANNFQFISSSPNNYEKRLRLDSVYSFSNDNAEARKTFFTYSNIPLNRRDSRNQDFWGYMVNPSRNCRTLIPRMKMEAPERFFTDFSGGSYGYEFDGSDRTPDSVYAQAGILKKITYPTGGSTFLEYESNRGFSASNYFEDDAYTPNLLWHMQNSDSSIAIEFPNRASEEVEINFSAQEFDSRPPPPAPGEPAMCIGDGQDNLPVTVIIDAMDLNFTPLVFTYPYSDFHSGVKLTLNLPLNINPYRITFVYPATNSCAYYYPFDFYAIARYKTPKQDKIVGGLRIKRMYGNDGTSAIPFDRKYDYNLPDGVSSANVVNVPNFNYHRVGIDGTQLHDIGMTGWTYIYETIHLFQVSRKSTPNFALDSKNGSPLVYTKVEERLADGSKILRKYDPIYSNYIDSFPYTPRQNYPELSGLILEEDVISAIGDTVKKVEHTFEKNTDFIDYEPNLNVAFGRISSAIEYNGAGFASKLYAYRRSHVKETSVRTTLFQNGITQTSDKSFEYENVHNLLKSVTTVDSKNILHKQHIYYCFEQGPYSSPYNDMISLNMLNYPVVQEEQKYPDTIPDPSYKATLTGYERFDGLTGRLPNTLTTIIGKDIQNIPPIVNDEHTQDILTINRYDISGNVQEYKRNNESPVCVVWGYQNQYPIARIAGTDYNDFVNDMGTTLTDLTNPQNTDAQIRNIIFQIQTYYRNNKNVQVFGYTYKPLVGMTSEISPNGTVMYYEYNGFNELTRILDADGHVMKAFENHLAN